MGSTTLKVADFGRTSHAKPDAQNRLGILTVPLISMNAPSMQPTGGGWLMKVARPNCLAESTKLMLLADESVRLSQYPLSTVLACRLFSQNNGGPTGHAPPLPRAAPGRPLQGRTSWPTPWTVQQAACGSLARATSAVGRALR